MYRIFDEKYYIAIVIESAGNISIPLKIRRSLNVKSGDTVMFFVDPKERFVTFIPAKKLKKFLSSASKTISDLKGIKKVLSRR